MYPRRHCPRKRATQYASAKVFDALVLNTTFTEHQPTHRTATLTMTALDQPHVHVYWVARFRGAHRAIAMGRSRAMTPRGEHWQRCLKQHAARAGRRHSLDPILNNSYDYLSFCLSRAPAPTWLAHNGVADAGLFDK